MSHFDPTHDVIVPYGAPMAFSLQGACIPVSAYLQHANGERFGVVVAEPFSDLVLIDGMKITPSLRARIREAIVANGGTVTQINEA